MKKLGNSDSPTKLPARSIRSLLRKRSTAKTTIPLPPDGAIAKICTVLVRQAKREEHLAKYAPVKEILALIGRGAVIPAALLAPKAAPLLLSLVRESPDRNAWKHYNSSYLKRTLRRLEKQKQVEIVEENGQQVFHLTQHGKRKILKYSFDTLKVEKPKSWDRKWRLVIYDVPENEDRTRDVIRSTLRSLGFYQIQESVYLFPYPCFNQIEFLRQYYFLGLHVQYMVVERIEHDEAHKTYFNLI